ncbi:redoxin family protein [Acetomicrobium hydrogeniformans ATCC BAA-1850]|uniref:Thiol peroxidase n=1 Tax=Acetomicrobium hydrogeniformans ATCC BAA-1850 TaxID=592015 RepID=A0A0T5X9Q1_9BACT|nr:redoxin family protein [Acetomicrobium hydrogeniformans ATCC BAA-1850]
MGVIDLERKGVVTMHGNPITLIGPELKVGDKAPDFTVIDQDMKEVKKSNFANKIKVISVTPSLDTSVCDVQAHRFEEEATSLPDDVVVLNISMDLPFAIKRFCTSGNIKKVIALSDHRDASFGTNWGVLIKELRLLARSVFIADKDDVIRYVQIVPEATNHPDYDAALKALKELIK